MYAEFSPGNKNQGNIVKVGNKNEKMGNKTNQGKSQ